MAFQKPPLGARLYSGAKVKSCYQYVLSLGTNDWTRELIKASCARLCKPLESRVFILKEWDTIEGFRERRHGQIFCERFSRSPGWGVGWNSVDGLKTGTWREKHIDSCDYSLNKLLRLVQNNGCTDGCDRKWEHETSDLGLQRSYAAEVGMGSLRPSTFHSDSGCCLHAFSTPTWPSAVAPWGCALNRDIAILNARGHVH